MHRLILIISASYSILKTCQSTPVQQIPSLHLLYYCTQSADLFTRLIQLLLDSFFNPNLFLELRNLGVSLTEAVLASVNLNFQVCNLFFQICIRFG